MNKRGSFLLKFFVVKLIVGLIVIVFVNFNKTDMTINAQSVDTVIEEKTSEEQLLSYSNYSNYDILKRDSKILVDNYKNEATDVLVATNKYRSNIGVNKLVLDDKLSEVATIRAMEIALNNKFSHERPDGTYYSKLFDELNVSSRTSGENIAYGYKDGYEVTAAWKTSKGHYANMINDSYNKLGVGIYTYNGTTYWVQIFTN